MSAHHPTATIEAPGIGCLGARTMAEKKDYYLILGVPREATADGIRKAFCRQAKASHPDRSGSPDTADFHDVVEAYETLSDPTKRRLYDGASAPAAAAEPFATDGVRVAGRWTPGADPLAPGGRVRRPFAGAPEPLIPEPGTGAEPEPLIPETRFGPGPPPAHGRRVGPRLERPLSPGPDRALLQLLLRSLRFFS